MEHQERIADEFSWRGLSCRCSLPPRRSYQLETSAAARRRPVQRFRALFRRTAIMEILAPSKSSPLPFLGSVGLLLIPDSPASPHDGEFGINGLVEAAWLLAQFSQVLVR